MKGLFFTLEGPEGSGKSTQVRLLAEYLSGRGEDVLQTREPGGTEIGDQIREILHSLNNTAMTPAAELLLYSAARAQIVDEVIRPALDAGKIVLSDRYADSTIAYQGYGRLLDLQFVRRLTEFATGGLKPDLTFFIDVAVDEGLQRRREGQTRGEEWNRMDALSRDFYDRVHAGYREMMREEPDRWVYIDGSQGIDSIQDELRRRMDVALEQFRRTHALPR